MVDSLAMAHRAGYTAGGAIIHSDYAEEITKPRIGVPVLVAG